MSPESVSCAACETALSAYREGELPPPEAAAVRRHLASCAACAALLDDLAAALEQLRSLGQAAPPPALFQAVVAATLPAPVRGPVALRPAAAFARWRAALGHAWRSPRFAMGVAMAVFAVALLLNAANVNLRQLFRGGWRGASARLSPVHLLAAGDRQVSRVWARGVSVYQELRVVYEIEASEQRLRQPPAPPAPRNSGSRTLLTPDPPPEYGLLLPLRPLP